MQKCLVRQDKGATLHPSSVFVCKVCASINNRTRASAEWARDTTTVSRYDTTRSHIARIFYSQDYTYIRLWCVGCYVVAECNAIAKALLQLRCSKWVSVWLVWQSYCCWCFLIENEILLKCVFGDAECESDGFRGGLWTQRKFVDKLQRSR